MLVLFKTANCIYSLVQTTYLVSPCSPQMDVDDFEKTATDIFKEYFDHGDTQEVATSLEELSIRNIKHEVCSGRALLCCPNYGFLNEAHVYSV